jgi:hypothetical protein
MSADSPGSRNVGFSRYPRDRSPRRSISGAQTRHKVKLGEDWRAAHHLKRVLESDIVLVDGEGILNRGTKSAIDLAGAPILPGDIPAT